MECWIEKVTPPGLEPGTYGLENRCSILLSYGAILRGANIKDFLHSKKTSCTSLCNQVEMYVNALKNSLL